MRQVSEMANSDNVVEDFGYKREQRHGIMTEGKGRKQGGHFLKDMSCYSIFIS